MVAWCGKRNWRCRLPVRPLSIESTRSLAVCSAEGHIFAFGEAAIRSRVQDQPLAAQAAPPQLPAITAAVDLGGGRAAFCAPGSDRLLLYNPSRGQDAAQWLKLESPLACAVTPLGDGFVAPLSVGQVFYLSSDDGAQVGVPFQPRLEPGTAVNYQPAAIVDAANRRFVIADGREAIYLVEANLQPQPHLRAVAQAKSGPYPIESRVVVQGDVALAVGGSSHLLRFSLPSLEATGELALPAPVVWGPHAIASGVLVATADEQLILVAPDGQIAWSVKLEHGDLAGEPLAMQDAVLLAYRKGVVERRATADGSRNRRQGSGAPTHVRASSIPTAPRARSPRRHAACHRRPVNRVMIKTVARTLSVLLLTSAALVHAQEAQPARRPLIEREPFDAVVLNRANGGKTLEVYLLDLPQRPLTAIPTEGTLRVRLLERPLEEFEVSWANVAQVRVFEQMLFDEAQQLTAAGKFDEAYDHFARIQADYPNYPGLRDAISEYLRRNALALYQANAARSGAGAY